MSVSRKRKKEVEEEGGRGFAKGCQKLRKWDLGESTARRKGGGNKSNSSSRSDSGSSGGGVEIQSQGRPL